ncbi:cysteine--tRNA ligase [Kiritimatiella glycovorans]|uniref:Cysteine--tRNA ligase n=1 Tax=Kiritimatiella glycovorans TaxID=1307763 RepID=A0A0G3EGZ8_9BACT|nr:cysteine--tRNA ligase [Kiritimatiella glycovorans]AKJ64697.1 Cysteine--tRNA ligase [Kiritimatiella glycovorans]
MTLRLYNTMSRSREAFEPLEEGVVRMYTCGPTVYDFAHIGNFRAYVFEDLLRRYLRYLGYRVIQVQNLTDVDDKTIRGAREKGVPLKEYTKPYIDAFFEDLHTLNVEPAEFYPAATDHVQDMIDLVQTLMDKGYAYRAEDGSIYFSIDRFEEYGKLARLDREGMRSGARVAHDEYEKENVADFALWKAWTPEDGDVAWEAPWGRGRPGWHIECSAMSMHYLGPTLDIHTGGVDNIFPHHEDETAQSEAATGEPFVRYWMHCGYLVVEDKKMSKSLGNFFTLRDLRDRGFSGREIRCELASAHYRQSLNFTLRSLEAGRSALRRLDEFYRRLEETASGASPGELPAWARDTEPRFREAMDDDLNVSGASAAVFDAVHEGNRALDAGEVDESAAAAVLDLWRRLDTVFGYLVPPRLEVPEEIERMAHERQEARRRRDFDAADRIRDELAARGWVVKDTPEGPKLTRS